MENRSTLSLLCPRAWLTLLPLLCNNSLKGSWPAWIHFIVHQVTLWVTIWSLDLGCNSNWQELWFPLNYIQGWERNVIKFQGPDIDKGSLESKSSDILLFCEDKFWQFGPLSTKRQSWWISDFGGIWECGRSSIYQAKLIPWGSNGSQSKNCASEAGYRRLPFCLHQMSL